MPLINKKILFFLLEGYIFVTPGVVDNNSVFIIQKILSFLKLYHNFIFIDLFSDKTILCRLCNVVNNFSVLCIQYSKIFITLQKIKITFSSHLHY